MLRTAHHCFDGLYHLMLALCQYSPNSGTTSMVEQTMSHRIGLHWSAFHCPLFCPSLHLYDDEDSGCLLHQVSRGLGSLWQDVLGSGNSNRRPTMGHVDVTKHLLRSRLPLECRLMHSRSACPCAFGDSGLPWRPSHPNDDRLQTNGH